GLSHRVKIVEKDNGAVTSTKQFVWIPGDRQPSEERDGSNTVTKRFYPQGMQVGSTNYYYTKDHLGSIRELTDSSGVVQTRYDYDPYGRRTKLTGDVDADFGFTGDYYHQPSGLNLALYRAYDADLGRWVSRDPLTGGEIVQGPSLYAYVRNSPISQLDPMGLASLITVEGGGGTGVTIFDPRPEGSGGPYLYPSSNSVFPNSLPGAAGPYVSGNIYILPGPHNNDPNAYGPNAIIENRRSAVSLDSRRRI